MGIYPSSLKVSGRFDGSAAISQYRAVVKTGGSADFFEAVNAADEKIAGILQNAVLANGYEQSETIVYTGLTKAIAGGVIDEGDPLTVDSVGRVVEAKGTLTTTLTGSNNDLVWTETDAGRGKIKSIEYWDPGGTSATGRIENLGGHVRVYLTRSGGAITETADTIKTLLAAHTELAALIAAVDSGADDGSGAVTALAATPLTGAQNIIGVAREPASGAGSEIDILLIGKAV